MQILIVEDGPECAAMLELLVEECGHTVVGRARSFVAARELARVLRPDLAVIDLLLDDGNTGADLAVALHKELGIRPLFVTGLRSLLTPAADAISAGMLFKPVSMNEMAAGLRMAALAVGGGEGNDEA